MPIYMTAAPGARNGWNGSMVIEGSQDYEYDSRGRRQPLLPHQRGLRIKWTNGVIDTDAMAKAKGWDEETHQKVVQTIESHPYFGRVGGRRIWKEKTTVVDGGAPKPVVVNTCVQRLEGGADEPIRICGKDAVEGTHLCEEHTKETFPCDQCDYVATTRKKLQGHRTGAHRKDRQPVPAGDAA